MDDRKEHVAKMSLEDRWLMAGLEGNVIFPQASLSIALFEAGVLLDADPKAIVGYASHSYTPEEINKAAKIMRAQHKKHGIPEQLTEKVIEDGDLSSLLYAEKETIRQVLKLVLNVQHSDEFVDDERDLKTHARRLAEVLTDPNNEETITIVRTMLAAAKTVLRSSSELSKQYKDWIDKAYKSFVSQKKRDDIPRVPDRIKNGECPPYNNMRKKIAEAWGKILGENYPKTEIKQMVNLFS